MNDYICRIANKEDLLKRWDYLIKTHKGNGKWVTFKENAIRNFEKGNTITLYGLLNEEIICELTVYIKQEAFDGDISDPSGLLSDDMAYLAAFRTNKEYEGKGYFSKLYRFTENYLKEKEYTALSLGVGPEDVRDIEIYFHYGFKEYIKTTVEHDTEKNEYINFYKKRI